MFVQLSDIVTTQIAAETSTTEHYLPAPVQHHLALSCAADTVTLTCQ